MLNAWCNGKWWWCSIQFKLTQSTIHCCYVKYISKKLPFSYLLLCALSSSISHQLRPDLSIVISIQLKISGKNIQDKRIFTFSITHFNNASSIRMKWCTWLRANETELIHLHFFFCYDGVRAHVCIALFFQWTHTKIADFISKHSAIMISLNCSMYMAVHCIRRREYYNEYYSYCTVCWIYFHLEEVMSTNITKWTVF